MANERFTDLPVVSNATTADIICAVQGGVSVQETLSQVIALALSQTILNYAGNPNGNVAGVVYQLLWDTTDGVLYICTVTGNAITAVWTATTLGGVIGPANGGTGVANPTAHTLPIAQGSGNWHFIGPGTNGQIPIGSTGNDPIWANIAAGANITITNTSGGVQIASAGGTGFTWNHQTTSSATLAVANGYITDDSSSLVTYTLPSVSALGDTIQIIGRSADGWTVVYGTGQYIIFGVDTSTTTTRNIASTVNSDCIIMVCTKANLEWTIVNAVGNITIV